MAATAEAERRGRPIWGIAALIVLVICCASRLGAAYIRTTRNDVQLGFFQEGLEHGNQFQIGIDCALKGYSKPPEEEIVSLGWLRKNDVVTIQAHLEENQSGYVEYWLNVNGRRLQTHHTPGKRGTPEGIGATRHQARWLLAQSFIASGAPLVAAGCKETPRRLELAGWSAPQHWETSVLNVTILASTVARWGTFALGLALVCGWIVLQALPRQSEPRPQVHPIWAFGAIVFAAVGVTAALASPITSKVLADLATAGIGLIGAWWLRYQLAAGAERLRNVVMRDEVLRRHNPEPTSPNE